VALVIPKDRPKSKHDQQAPKGALVISRETHVGVTNQLLLVHGICGYWKQTTINNKFLDAWHVYK
jgi:hypothetical protein